MANCYLPLQDYVICDVHIYQKSGTILFLYDLNICENYMPKRSSHCKNDVFTWLRCLMSVTLDRKKIVHLNEHQMLDSIFSAVVFPLYTRKLV